MPTWTKSPPDDTRGQGLPIVRTPANSELRAIITSPSLAGCDTHFWGGHTVPCERPNCDACKAGSAWRWHGYLTAFNPQDELHFIFEMTPQAARVFAAYQQQNGTLRCAQFRAYRWGRRKNGRVIIQIEHSACPSHSLPEPPNIQAVMAIIWRLPAPNVEIHGVERGIPKLFADSRGNGESADPREYAQPNP